MKNLNVEKKVFISTTMAILYILLVLITCTCSGRKSTSERQSIEKQTDYFSYSGKPAKQITGVTVCVILKIEGVVFRSWHLQNLSTWPRLVPTRDLGSYLKVVQTLRKCSQTKSYPLVLIIRSSSNQYKTEWIVLKPNSPIEYQRLSLQEGNLKPMSRSVSYKGWIPL